MEQQLIGSTDEQFLGRFSRSPFSFGQFKQIDPSFACGQCFKLNRARRRWRQLPRHNRQEGLDPVTCSHLPSRLVSKLSYIPGSCPSSGRQGKATKRHLGEGGVITFWLGASGSELDMSALRQGLHRSHATLLFLWLTVTFAVLPSEISAASSCGTGQEDGDRVRSCSSTENHGFGGLDERDRYAVNQVNAFKDMERPDVPLEAWQSVSGLSILLCWHIEYLK